MQLSVMRTHVLDLIGQDSSAQDVFTVALLNRWINMAGKEIARFIRKHSPYEFTKSGSLPVTAGTREYDLIATFSDFLDLHFVEQSVTGSTTPQRMEIDRVRDRGNRNIPGNRLYLRAHTLGYYTAPGSSETLTIHYAPTLTELSADTDDWDTLSIQNPRVRDEFQDAVLYETVFMLLSAEGGLPTMIGLFRGKSAESKASIRDALTRRVAGPRYMNITSRVHRGSC